MLLGGCLAIAVVAPASADDLPRPSLKLDITLPAVYNNNFALSRTDTVDGLNATPAGQLTLGGNFSKNLSYTTFVAIERDRYDKDNTAFASDDLQLSFGLVYNASDWKLSSSYTAKWLYAPTFETFDARFDDYIFTATAPALVLGSAGKIVGLIGYRERQSTDTISSHHSPYVRATWTKDLPGLAEGWTAKVDYVQRYLEYDQGRSVTARDWRGVQTFSLSRDLVPNLNLDLSAIHDRRDSNILERHYDDWTVGFTLALTVNIF